MKKSSISILVAAGFCSAAPASAAPPQYQSVFDGYRKFDDIQVQDWRKANHEVEQIGGWLSYTREAQQELKAEKERAVAAPATTPPIRGNAQQQPSDVQRPDPHKGHSARPAGKK
ncbi:MAG: hypothetical protein RL341_2507 [Pseudomonadota bacterium]